MVKDILFKIYIECLYFQKNFQLKNFSHNVREISWGTLSNIIYQDQARMKKFYGISIKSIKIDGQEAKQNYSLKLKLMKDI